MKWTALVLIAAAAGCAAHRRTAGRGPAPDGPTPHSVAPAAGSDEPAACAFYAGDDRPDYEVQDLQCIVNWMREIQDYLAAGGKPTKNTNPAALENYRQEALKLGQKLNDYVLQAAWRPTPPHPVGPRAEPPTAAIAPSASTATVSGATAVPTPP